jgi:hypothetical protein
VRWPLVLALVAVMVVVRLLTGAQLLPVIGAVLVGWVMLKVGFMILTSFAAPPPEPPPAGELRRVKITYRCSICGTEVRMTTANDEVPDAPRHCLEDMDLVTPVDDL